MAAMKGVRISLVNEVTTAPKAAPMTTATAKSTTLPLKMKARNSFHIRLRSSAWLAAVLAAVLFGLCGRAWAGPPFRTDDPEPVPWRHWEVYIASTGFYSRLLGGFSTLPHVEVNYGPVPGVQLHM